MVGLAASNNQCQLTSKARLASHHNLTVYPRQLIKSSPVWDTSCLAELIYDLINRFMPEVYHQNLVAIQYFPAAELSKERASTMGATSLVRYDGSSSE